MSKRAKKTRRRRMRNLFRVLKVFIEDGRIFAWEKSASPSAQDSSASIETCTRCGKVSERNSGVEITGETS